MNSQRLIVAATLVAASSATVAAAQNRASGATAPGQTRAPQFVVDAAWPKPLPPRTLLGSANGVFVDARDHVFVINNPASFTTRTEIGSGTNPPTGNCCSPSSPILEFDPTGKLVRQWGGPGPGYDWPATPSGIGVDPQGNVWIGGSAVTDAHVLKFSREGKFLLQSGKPLAASGRGAATDAGGYAAGVLGGGRGAGAPATPAGGRGTGATATPAPAAGRGRGNAWAGPVVQPPGASDNMEMLGAPARFSFDATANEVFVADGYRNRRVAVLDMATGKIKRSIGAYGNKPDDADLGAYDPAAPAAKQFRSVTCVARSKDGLLYVCDRGNNRIQVFQKNGTFAKEKSVAPRTLGEGSVWDIAFSNDAQQRYLYVADGANARVRILDRQSLDELATFGDGGRYPSQFLGLQGIATDSKGNIYTTETYEGKRVQKFDFKGISPVTKHDQGTVWPGGSR